MNKLIYKILFSGVLFTNTYGGGSESEEGSAEVSYSTEPNDAALSSQPQLEDLILKEICALCEKPGFEDGDPFCLNYDFRNIRSHLTDYIIFLKPTLYKLKTKYNQDELCDSICHLTERFIKDHIKASHLHIVFDSDKIRDFKISLNSIPYRQKPSEFYIKDKYVIIKITDFKENFDIEKLKEKFDEIIDKKKGLILDFKDNLGGRVTNLMNLFYYFFNDRRVISYYITRKHQPFFGETSSYKEQLSKQELKELLTTIQTNWNIEEEPWKINDYLDGHPIVQNNIAILINKKTASCSEEFTLALKAHYPNRVKIIGEKSAGSLLTSYSCPLKSFPGLSLTYPTEEVIGVDGTRVEGVGIEPDIVSNDEEEIMKAAIEWVTQEPK